MELNEFFAKTLIGSKEEGISSLLQSAREGHLCLKTASFPALPSSVMEEGKTRFPKTPIVKDQDRYYLQKNWVLETYLLEQVARLRKQKIPSFYNQEQFLGELEKEQKLSLDQKAIAKHLFSHPFSILCGGPGTGKTHTAACFVKLLLSSQPLKIVLAAPTGKAALHLQSTLFAKTGIECEAKTLHRLLRLKPGENRLFSQKRIDADVVIVDESSMMDISLLAHLLGATGDQTRLLLMGDPSQLPPVEIGGVFAELAELYGVFLQKCMRTEDPLLQQSSHSILQGDEKGLFASVQVMDGLDDTLVEYLYEKIQPMFSRAPIDPVQVLQRSAKLACLNALRQGPFGLEVLNRKILEKMDKECPDGFYWACPIMASANLATIGLYNGSTGVLVGQKNRKIHLFSGTAYFPETGTLERLPPFEISFVLSIHKSQGSEFEEVIAIFPEGSESFGKEALYTAATRAKKRWEIIGKKETLQKILMKNSAHITGFKERSTPDSSIFCEK